MARFFHPFSRVFARAQRRLQAARPGIVLIAVIALLVLLALIGIAFLITARNDRYSAKFNTYNTQIDLLKSGVQRIALGDIAQNGIPQLTTGADGYPSADSLAVDVTTSPWLSSRVPTTLAEACSEWNGLFRSYKCGEWAQRRGKFFVCINPYGVTAAPNMRPPEDSHDWLEDTVSSLRPDTPCWPALTAPLLPGAVGVDLLTGQTYDGAAGRFLAQPTSITVGKTVYPALRIYNASAGTFSTVLAASATGDGIADSMLMNLVPGKINGIDYFAAVRVVDGNSAINLNTANSALFDFDGNGKPITEDGVATTDAFFPGSIGLAELFPDANLAATSDMTLSRQLLDFNLYRHASIVSNGSASASDYAFYRPYGIDGDNTMPITDNGSFRPDFMYRSEADALFMGLGRRTVNPAYSIKQNTVGLTRFGAFTWSDSADLAYKMEQSRPTSESYSVAEKVIPETLQKGIPQLRFSASEVGGIPPTFREPTGWFGKNYYYGTPDTYLSPTDRPTFNIRPLVVAKNAINAYMPFRSALSVPPEMGFSDATPYFGRATLNIADSSTLMGKKTGVIHLPTLWLGFFNAMSDALSFPYVPDPTKDAQLQPPGGRLYPQQFRSSLRDPRVKLPATTLNLMEQPENANLVRFPPDQMLLLRSLIAAVNAKDLRDSDDDISSDTIQLKAMVDGALTPVTVTAFGTERQPFITEVYFNNDSSPAPDRIPDTINGGTKENSAKGKFNPRGYIAIELYNPYDTPINLRGWALAGMQRQAGEFNETENWYPYPSMMVWPVETLDTGSETFHFGDITIPARGFIVVDNFHGPVVDQASDASATYRPYELYPGFVPPSSNVKFVFCANLTSFVKGERTIEGWNGGTELFLLRPRRSDGKLSPSYGESYAIVHLNGLVPVDSADLTGLHGIARRLLDQQLDHVFQAWHYVRANSDPNDTSLPPRSSWRQVYPGRWDASREVPEDGMQTGGSWDVFQGGRDPWLTNPPGIRSNWVAPATQPTSQPTSQPTTQPTSQPTTRPIERLPLEDGASAPINIGGPDYASSFTTGKKAFAPIQLNNTHGWNKNLVVDGRAYPGAARFPFGGFARVGDVLQVPYIGAYTVMLGDRVLEMNTVTRDAALADDLDDTNNDQEFIGTLCPMLVYDVTRPKVVPATINGKDVYIPNYDYYGWASHVLDCFTTLHCNGDDYFPHTDPDYDPISDSTKGHSRKYFNWDPVSGTYPLPTDAIFQPTVPEFLPGTRGIKNNNGGEGFININTAPWRVLAAVPWKTPDKVYNTPGAIAVANGIVAQRIVEHRLRWGPFKSLLDLNRVDLSGGTSPLPTFPFQNLNGSPPVTPDPNNSVGGISPDMVGKDGIRNGLIERMQSITRVSNLLTTRSDSFTVYVVIQGWRGFNSPNPELVVQRRVAFIVDRSGMPGTGYPRVIATVPTQ